VKGLKKAWFAAVLALALGGPGCFYLGWRRGAKATLGWLLGMAFIMVNAKLPEPTIFCILLVHVFLAWKAYRSCKWTNAEAAKLADIPIPGTAQADDATLISGRKPLIGWKRAACVFGKAVLTIVGVLGSMIALFLIDLSLVDWHYRRMQKSIRPGMTIEEVLRTVQESGLVNGYPQHLEGDEERHGVAFCGRYDGGYSLLAEHGPSMSEGEAAKRLRENMVPGRDYRIGFTFTPGVGPHWSITVMLSPEGRVKEVVPFHTWD